MLFVSVAIVIAAIVIAAIVSAARDWEATHHE